MMHPRASAHLALALSSALLAGCADTYNNLYYDTRAPLRVAVLPFTAGEGGDLVTSVPFAAVVDALPIIGSDDDRNPPTVLRWAFTTRVRQTRMDVVNPGYVDSVLAKNGLFEEAKFLEKSPNDLGRILGADAIVYGEVTSWDRSHYVVESVQTVGCRIKMYETRTGTLLWEAEEEASEDSGLSGGPTGYVSAALEPIRGLSARNMPPLADEVARRIVEPHMVGGGQDGAASEVAPYIVAAAHSPAGQPGLVPGSEIHVVAIGSPDCHATFSLGEFRRNVPMTEFDGGIYAGTYVVQPADRFPLEAIEVEFVGTNGAVTLQRIENRVSRTGATSATIGR